MDNLIYHILIAVTTFAVTNIDDLLILSIYFSNSSYTTKSIVTGQYLGVFILVAISLSGMVLGEFIDEKWIKTLGLIPIFLGIKNLIGQYKKNKFQKTDGDNPPLEFTGKTGFTSVALITFANGGDNIGVYTPLFANTQIKYIYFYILIFSVMIGLWCLLGYYIIKHSSLKTLFQKFGELFLPFFLIILGVFLIVK